MKQFPLISVVIPVYEVESFLEKCVRSAMEQTCREIEIILVDDGSPDQCPQMCDMYAQQDERIIAIHQINGGLSTARNRGVLAARGKYILFLDSDDEISLDACEKLLPFLNQECDIVIGDGIASGGIKRLMHGNLPIGKIADGKEYLKKALWKNKMPMPAWLCVYRREFLLENDLLFRDGLLHEDEQFTPRAFLSARKVVESGVIFYHYVLREESITTKKDMRKNAEDFFSTCLELRAIYEKLEDRRLRIVLLDSLVVKYLSLCQQGKLYQYGKKYIHKRFVWENAHRIKTKGKAILFCAAPRVYWHINYLSKLRKAK